MLASSKLIKLKISKESTYGRSINDPDPLDGRRFCLCPKLHDQVLRLSSLQAKGPRQEKVQVQVKVKVKVKVKE
jgi:hypothetical protein